MCDYRNGTEIWKNLVLNNTWNVCWHMYIITYIHERINEISFSHQYTLIRYVCTSKSFAMYAMLNCQSSHSEYLKDTYCWRIISLPEYILLSLTGNWTCDYNLNIKIPVTTVFIFFSETTCIVYTVGMLVCFALLQHRYGVRCLRGFHGETRKGKQEKTDLMDSEYYSGLWVISRWIVRQTLFHVTSWEFIEESLGWVRLSWLWYSNWRFKVESM